MFDDGVNEWLAVDTYLKKELRDLLTDYAINHGLQNGRGWRKVNIAVHSWLIKRVVSRVVYHVGDVDNIKL